MDMRDFFIACLQQTSSQQQGFWTFNRTTETQIISGLTISGTSPNFYYNIDWGDGTNVTTKSNTLTGHIYTNTGQNIVRVTPVDSTPTSIIRIDCNRGVSIPNRVGGVLDISSFPNLTGMNISLTKITNIKGFEVLTKLYNLQLANNEFTQPFLDLSRNTNLQTVSLAVNNFTGSVPTNLPQLRTLNCSQNYLTGPMISLPTSLESFNCSNQLGTTKISGDIPDLSNLTSLQSFNCNSNQLSGVYEPFIVSNTVSNFAASNNSLTSSAVNKILAALVAAGRQGNTGDIVNIGGGNNSAPTGQGLIDKATLISRSWSVITK